jgi:hypothetical protein
MDWNINQPTSAVFDEGVYAAFEIRGGRGDADPVTDFWASALREMKGSE